MVTTALDNSSVFVTRIILEILPVTSDCILMPTFRNMNAPAYRCSCAERRLCAASTAENGSTGQALPRNWT